MRLRKQTLVVLVPIVLILGLATAVSERWDEEEEGQLTIGLAVANLQADFFNQIKQSVSAQAGKDNVKVIVADAKGDANTQVSQIQDFVTRQVDAIIYIPAGATAASVPVERADDAGIPVVAVDRNPPDAPAKTFIASDSVAGARDLGDYVVKQSKGRGNVAILRGQIGTTPELDRAKGFNQALRKAPGMRVVAQQPADWEQGKAFDVAQNMLQSNPNIDVFFGRADAMALGAAQATRVANKKSKTLIVGFDGDKAGLRAVRNGTIQATMVQQTQRMGRMAVRDSIRLARGRKVPRQQLLPAFLTTRKSAAKYLEEHP